MKGVVLLLEFELATKAKQDELVEKVVELDSTIKVLKHLSVIKSDKDSEGIFTTVTYKRKSDDTIYCISVLSGGTSPMYTTKTEQFYDEKGESVIETITYSLSYDEDGNLISEV